MKLYAVTLKAKLIIQGREYAERDQPISKYAHMPAAQRAVRGYVPAVYTSKTNAQKLIAKLPAQFRGDYKIINFDSGWEDYPVPQ